MARLHNTFMQAIHFDDDEFYHDHLRCSVVIAHNNDGMEGTASRELCPECVTWHQRDSERRGPSFGS